MKGPVVLLVISGLSICMGSDPTISGRLAKAICQAHKRYVDTNTLQKPLQDGASSQPAEYCVNWGQGSKGPNFRKTDCAQNTEPGQWHCAEEGRRCCKDPPFCQRPLWCGWDPYNSNQPIFKPPQQGQEGDIQSCGGQGSPCCKPGNSCNPPLWCGWDPYNPNQAICKPLQGK